MKYHSIKLLALGIFAASILLISPKVSAVSNVGPDPADNSASDIYFSVAKTGTNYKLDAPQSVLIIYSPTASGSVTIEDGKYCGNNNGGIDSVDDGEGGRGIPWTNYTIFKANDTEGVTATVVDTDTNFLAADACTSRDITMNFSGLTKSTKLGHTNYYVAYFVAEMASGSFGGYDFSAATNDSINGFKLRVNSPGGYISYSKNSGTKFAQGQFWLQPQRSATHRLKFAPDCGYAGGSQVIRWFDADIGQSNQSGNISTTLSEYNATTGALNWNQDFNMTGGQDADGSYTFNAQPNTRYVWTINNVDSRNGIQFNLPFDSFNFVQDCSIPTVTVSIDTDCKLLRYRGRTGTNSNYDARLRVNGSDTGTLTTNIPNNEERTFDISSYAAGTSFEVRVRDTLTGKSTTSVALTKDASDCGGDTDTGDFNCKLDPGFDRYHTVSPPDTTPNNPAPSGYAGSPGATDTENRPQSKYEITAAYDQYSPRTNITWDPTGKSSGPFELDYINFLEYPYDSHNVTYEYKSYYDVYEYTSSSTESFGSSDNNGDGDTSDPGETYSLGYAWNSGVLKESNKEATGSASATNMPQCFHRGFEMTPAFNNIQWDDIEEVTQLSIGSSVQTEYKIDPDAPSDSLRNPNRVVDASVNVQVTLYHSDGRPPESYPLPEDSSCVNEFLDGKFTTPSSLSFNTVSTNSTDCYQAKIPPLSAGDYACVTVEFPFTRGTMDQSGAVQTSSTNITIPDPEGDQVGEIGCTPYLVDRPYFTVYGGDVSVGSSFNTVPGSCTIETADIRAWNRGSQPASSVYPNTQFGGSGTTLAAYAVGVIEVFSTATRRINPGPMDGLAFSNQSSPPGNLSTDAFICLPDYRAEATGGAPSSNISGLDGSYSTTGTHTITTSTVGNGRRIAIFADTVVINGNITTNKTGYNSLEDIPSVRIIAQNIYIHPDVTNVDATLIAQGGNIYTCSNGGAGAPSDDSIANANFNSPNNSCKDQNLTIRGSLIGTTVNLTRGKGSIRNSNTANDYNFSGAAPNVAERIIYSPAIWLTNFQTKIQEEAPYDAFTSMPPIL